MISPHHIMRRHADPDQLDFEGLRRQGIALLQDLSKGKWTDYNLHDPGVTLLELLCYGLTDLLYRTEFSIADFLTYDDGQIRYKEQALFAPQDIFPNQALTDLDFCKLIYDSLPAVDDVWITQAKTNDQIAGLFSVFIKPHESLFSHNEIDEDANREQLRLDVLGLLAQHRNLCRDVAQVQIVIPHAYSLAGEIEIDDSRPRSEIYADIYFQCAKLISCGSRITRFEEALQQGMSWEQIFDGPLTEHGYIDGSHFSQDNSDIEAIKLITLVRHIPGVKNVRSLYLLDEQGHGREHLRFTHHDTTCPVLHFPKDHKKILALRLVHGRSAALEANDAPSQNAVPRQSTREIDAFAEQVSLYLKKYEFEHEAFRHNLVHLDKIVQLPQGQARQFAEYTSLGEDTPAIYGINRYGVPKSEPAEVHARARQLKAYLYPFEQIMANYLASLQHVRHVYSLDENLQRSYFAQFLEDTEIPDIQRLYTKQANRQQVDQILREQDNFNDRRNRVLDTLLAIYGEQFPEEDLRRYAFYHRSKVDQHIINCKIHLLQHLCEISSQRGQAINLMREYGDGSNCASLQRRLSILIGNYEHSNGRHVSKVLQDSVQYLSHSRYKEKLAKQINFPTTLKVEQTIAVSKDANEDTNEDTNKATNKEVSKDLTKNDFELPHDMLSDNVLRSGVFLENYHYYPDGENHAWLCLINGHEEVLPVCLLPLAELSAYAVAMQEKIVAINQLCEGFHIVEHVLLRPRGTDEKTAESEEFYAHRISIILPGFTARFADKKCRRWIENLIAQNLPAHVLPEFYWLDFAFFAQFEMRYLQWLDHMQTSSLAGFSGELKSLDDSAQNLVAFLKKNRPQHELHYWI